MSEPISASQFHERTDLPDWRVLLRRIEATFRAPSFAGAAAFVEAIAEAADAADHHPDVDLRYPGRVHVTLTTHAVDGLSDADVALAAQISALAAQAGLSSEPTSAIRVEMAIDALDIDAVRPFWKAVLDYAETVPWPGEQVTELVDPLRIGPTFWFQQMDTARPQRNRIHIDIVVTHDVAEQRVADALAAGGTLLSDRRAKAFWVLADPEGNEACICTWQDRD
jgi:4a-hydroxytetrahydrobiopterin dehydratase